MDKNTEITPEMIEAGLREYLRAFSDEDDPACVVKAIYQAMFSALHRTLSQESS